MSIRKIYVRFPNWVGDAVMALPFLSLLQDKNPGAHITVAYRTYLASLLWADPRISERMPVTHDQEHRLLKIFKWAARLKREHFDEAYILPVSFSAALPAFLAGVPVRTGWPTDGRSLLLNRRVQRDDPFELRHQIIQYADLLSLNLTEGLTRIPLPVLQASETHVSLARKAMMRFRFGSLQPPLVALGPSASYGGAKKWIASRFAALIEKLKRELGASVLFLGTQNDKECFREIQAFCREKIDGVFTGEGEAGLAELIGLLAVADLYIGNDSGGAHVAAALGRRTLVLFGSTAPSWTAPRGDRVRVLYDPPECSPCFLKACPLKRQVCMERISVETVFRTAEEMLK